VNEAWTAVDATVHKHTQTPHRATCLLKVNTSATQGKELKDVAKGASIKTFRRQEHNTLPSW
jgi:hypothetical protein